MRILILKRSCFNRLLRYTPSFLISESGVRKMLLIPKGVVCGKTVYVFKLLECSLRRGGA